MTDRMASQERILKALATRKRNQQKKLDEGSQTLLDVAKDGEHA